MLVDRYYDAIKNLLEKASTKGIKIDTVCAGDSILVDDVRIDVLYPNRNNEISNN